MPELYIYLIEIISDWFSSNAKSFQVSRIPVSQDRFDLCIILREFSNGRRKIPYMSETKSLQIRHFRC